MQAKSDQKPDCLGQPLQKGTAGLLENRSGGTGKGGSGLEDEASGLGSAGEGNVREGRLHSVENQGECLYICHQGHFRPPEGLVPGQRPARFDGDHRAAEHVLHSGGPVLLDADDLFGRGAVLDDLGFEDE